MAYGFYFDSSRCTGCKTCEMACKDYWDLGSDLAYRKVYDYEGGTWEQQENGSWEQNAFVYHLSMSCNHCSLPVCVQVCPTGAMHKESKYDLILVGSKVCVGCGYCTLACPYAAPSVSDKVRKSTKCSGCYTRLLEDKRPICVDACPMRALNFGEIGTLRKKYGELNAIAPMPEPATAPNIVIKACECSCEPGNEKGYIANPLEIT